MLIPVVRRSPCTKNRNILYLSIMKFLLYGAMLYSQFSRQKKTYFLLPASLTMAGHSSTLSVFSANRSEEKR